MKMILVALALAVPALAAAQHHGTNTLADPAPAGIPISEPGQASFAAIAELVAVLEADPNTDWSRVDVERLRRHLADMDLAMTAAAVEAVEVAGGARFRATGSPEVAASLRRMAAGHARTMTGADGWSYSAREIEGGVELEVTSSKPADAARIRGLGFAGLLARGSHHQAHHYAMATGRSPH